MSPSPRRRQRKPLRSHLWRPTVTVLLRFRTTATVRTGYTTHCRRYLSLEAFVNAAGQRLRRYAPAALLLYRVDAVIKKARVRRQQRLCAVRRPAGRRQTRRHCYPLTRRSTTSPEYISLCCFVVVFSPRSNFSSSAPTDPYNHQPYRQRSTQFPALRGRADGRVLSPGHNIGSAPSSPSSIAFAGAISHRLPQGVNRTLVFACFVIGGTGVTIINYTDRSIHRPQYATSEAQLTSHSAPRLKAYNSRFTRSGAGQQFVRDGAAGEIYSYVVFLGD